MLKTIGKLRFQTLYSWNISQNKIHPNIQKKSLHWLLDLPDCYLKTITKGEIKNYRNFIFLQSILIKKVSYL